MLIEFILTLIFILLMIIIPVFSNLKLYEIEPEYFRKIKIKNTE